MGPQDVKSTLRADVSAVMAAEGVLTCFVSSTASCLTWGKRDKLVAAPMPTKRVSTCISTR